MEIVQRGLGQSPSVTPRVLRHSSIGTGLPHSLEKLAMEGGVQLRQDVMDRVNQAALYILTTGATVRACARKMGVSKTTIHKDMRERLVYLHPGRAVEVGHILDRNRAERHIRGGEATRRKYQAEARHGRKMGSGRRCR